MAAALDPEDVHAVMDGFFALALEAVHAGAWHHQPVPGRWLHGPLRSPSRPGRGCGAGASRGSGDSIASRELQRVDPGSLRNPPRAANGSEYRSRLGRIDRRPASKGLHRRGAGGRTRRAPPGKLPRPGQILVGEETVRRCGGYFEFADRGKRQVRGVPGEVQVFELLAAGPHQGRIGLERTRGLTPFTGRSRELRALAQLAEPREGVRAVEIRGEAGIGKSRLVLEYLERLPPGTFAIETRCRESQTQRALRSLARAPAGLAAESPPRRRDRRSHRAPRGARGAVETPSHAIRRSRFAESSRKPPPVGH